MFNLKKTEMLPLTAARTEPKKTEVNKRPDSDQKPPAASVTGGTDQCWMCIDPPLIKVFHIFGSLSWMFQLHYAE